MSMGNFKKHLSVQQRIKQVAQHFNGCEYFFMNWAQLNVELDKVEKPTICYILPPSGTITPEKGAMVFTDKPETQIAFLAPTELDFDGEENDEIIELMKLLAIMFIKEMNRSGLFEFIDGDPIEYQVPYDTMDDNVTGIIVTLPISEQPDLFCRMPDTFGYSEEPPYELV